MNELFEEANSPPCITARRGIFRLFKQSHTFCPPLEVSLLPIVYRGSRVLYHNGSWKKSRQKENQIGCISTTDALEQRCHKKKVGSPQRALDGILWSWPAAGKVNWSRNKLASEKAILRNLRSRNSRRAK